MISLYVNALLCMLQHTVTHAMQLSGVNSLTPLSCIACTTICCSVHKSALTYKEITFSTFSLSTLHLHLFNFLCRVRDLSPRWSMRRRAGFSCAILYFTSYIFQLTPHVLRLIPYALRLTSYILRLTSDVLYLTSYTLHLTTYIFHRTSYVLHLPTYTSRLMSYTLRLTSYILHLTR